MVPCRPEHPEHGSALSCGTSSIQGNKPRLSPRLWDTHSASPLPKPTWSQPLDKQQKPPTPAGPTQPVSRPRNLSPAPSAELVLSSRAARQTYRRVSTIQVLNSHWIFKSLNSAVVPYETKTDGRMQSVTQRAVLAVTIPTTQSGKIITLPPQTMLDITSPAAPQFLRSTYRVLDLKWFDLMIVLHYDGAKAIAFSRRLSTLNVHLFLGEQYVVQSLDDAEQWELQLPLNLGIMRVNNWHIDKHYTARKPMLLFPFRIVLNKLHRSCSVVSDSTTLWTIACQVPLFMEFSRQRIMESVAISSSRGSSRPRDQTHVSPVSPTF